MFGVISLSQTARNENLFKIGWKVKRQKRLLDRDRLCDRCKPCFADS